MLGSEGLCPQKEALPKAQPPTHCPPQTQATEPLWACFSLYTETERVDAALTQPQCFCKCEMVQLHGGLLSKVK